MPSPYDPDLDPARWLIHQALEVIHDPSHWCRFTQAVDSYGRPTDPWDSRSVRWCAIGVMIAAGHRMGWSNTHLDDALDAVNDLCGPYPWDPKSSNGLAHFNDTRGHQATVGILTRALEKTG